MSPPPRFKLPDTLANWPWERRLNSHYAAAKTQSSAWLRSFTPFEPGQQRKFDLCDFNLLAALAYSLFNAEKLRVGCDFLNLVFVYDEYADVLDESGARLQATIVMDALRNPTKTRPQGECPPGEMARQFGERARRTTEGDFSSFDRFILEFDAYTTAVVKESRDHGYKHVLDINDYIQLRRDTSGVGPTLAIIEFGLKLPTDVITHPKFASLTADAITLVSLINDLNSYVREESLGQCCHNIVTVVMRQYQLDHNGAMNWLEVYITNVTKRFLENRESLPSWGEDIDTRLQTYIDGLGYWVRGNDCWSFEGHRYFGENGLAVQKNRWLQLQPPGTGYLGRRRQSLSLQH